MVLAPGCLHDAVRAFSDAITAAMFRGITDPASSVAAILDSSTAAESASNATPAASSIRRRADDFDASTTLKFIHNAMFKSTSLNVENPCESIVSFAEAKFCPTHPHVANRCCIGKKFSTTMEEYFRGTSGIGPDSCQGNKNPHCSRSLKHGNRVLTICGKPSCPDIHNPYNKIIFYKFFSIGP